MLKTIKWQKNNMMLQPVSKKTEDSDNYTWEINQKSPSDFK